MILMTLDQFTRSAVLGPLVPVERAIRQIFNNKKKVPTNSPTMWISKAEWEKLWVARDAMFAALPRHPKIRIAIRDYKVDPDPTAGRERFEHSLVAMATIPVDTLVELLILAAKGASR